MRDVGGAPLMACCRCKKPATEVGELKVYPPIMRPIVEVSDSIFPGALRYCGPCAVYKAVEDTHAQKTQAAPPPPPRRGPTAPGSPSIH